VAKITQEILPTHRGKRTVRRRRLHIPVISQVS